MLIAAGLLICGVLWWKATPTQRHGPPKFGGTEMYALKKELALITPPAGISRTATDDDGWQNTQAHYSTGYAAADGKTLPTVDFAAALAVAGWQQVGDGQAPWAHTFCKADHAATVTRHGDHYHLSLYWQQGIDPCLAASSKS
ncbi:hypothetical protein IGB42_01816 [Andreprevotia sp. IGB-42]|nr:hypothetical protein IGB42_01816 [Andreprevotia sp. IGB-42]